MLDLWLQFDFNPLLASLRDGGTFSLSSPQGCAAPSLSSCAVHSPPTLFFHPSRPPPLKFLRSRLRLTTAVPPTSLRRSRQRVKLIAIFIPLSILRLMK
ncbi:hypothetical protein ACS0TY_031762 [Phlomoides rotata]